MTVNLPDVVAEVAGAFTAYETALVAGDLATLTEAFWDSELVVRYGVAERLYGADQVERWRRAAPAIPVSRALGPTVITTFGTDFAAVSTEFRYAETPGQVGRQSQTWARLDGRWRIVAAHVSLQDEPEVAS